MLQKRLIILLLVLILLPTLIIGWISYRFSLNTIRSERIQIVGRVAQNRHEQLTKVLQQANDDAKALLESISMKCAPDDAFDRDCVSNMLASYLHGKNASGALFFRPDQPNEAVVAGVSAVSTGKIREFQAGQLAEVTPTSPEGEREFYVIAEHRPSPWRLAISYPAEVLQKIFAAHTDLGRSGESFLADRDGFFVTRAGHAAEEALKQPIIANPMQACLNHQNGEILGSDYRGAAIIHGFRYIPEIGGGCIMAHILQAEAFAPIVALEKQLLASISVFALIGSLAARTLARRIVAPITRLTNAAKRIRDGDHSIRAEVDGLDEISELASSFNHMTDALADAQHNLEAKVAERTQALRISEERYMLAERAVNDGIWDWDILHHEYYLSPRWNKILGYAEGELPNVESIFFELIHPDDKKPASVAFRRHLENNDRYATELRLRHKDGSYRWVLDRGEAIRDASGRPVRMVGSITDITERKAAEAQLICYRDHLEELVATATTEVKAIVETAVNGVITIDTEGSIRLFNPAAERLFGWRAEEVIGRNVKILMPEPFASAHEDHILRFLETRQSNIIGIEREVTALHKDGRTFPANLAVGHAVLAEGRHLFVGFISDITLQKQAEHELRLAKDAAEAAAKVKANFLANMSHEIRTPMNTIIGFAEVVLKDPSLPPATRKYIDTILDSGKHLLAVINDILDFSKIEAGKVELETICFNLPSAVQDTLQSIGLKAAEKGLGMELKIDTNLPQYFAGDPNRLRQVILNLVGNAVKFTESGLITVTINKAEGDDMVHFAIQDTGIGMTPEQTERVFEPFCQADTTTSRRFGGTGLGTTISKQLVELMGGRIWAESSLGIGSTFHFTIHLPETTYRDNCLYQPHSQHLVEYFSPRSFKVLLAEDIEANASLAILRLEQQGHEVHWVKNGLAAVNAFKQGGYDLILMDLQMPIMDGISATRQIRELETRSNSHIPVVALTASVLEHERRQCTEAGMDAIVGKPIDINELLEQMEILVPEGIGVARTAIPVKGQAVRDIDFSPVLSVADYRKGLATWRDPEAYGKALLNFANEHADDAERISSLLNQSPDAAKGAEQIAHALKGGSGNLALPDIFRLASDLDNDLKAGHLDNIEKQCRVLDNALKSAAIAIRQLKVAEQRPEVVLKAFDRDEVLRQLRKLTAALDELNPISSEPVLRELYAYLPPDDLDAIRRAIDHFDFDNAKTEVDKLLVRYADANSGGGA